MSWHTTPFTVPLVLSTLLSAVLLAYAWRRRGAVPAATAFAVLMGGLAEWTLAYALELSAQQVESKKLFASLRYPGIGAAVLGFLAVAVHFAGRGRWLTPPRIAAACLVPALSVVFAFTNDLHHLMWRHLAPDPDGPAMVSEHGPWFWLHMAYCYGAMLVASVLVVKGARSGARRLRQSAVMLASVSVPWLVSAVHLSGFIDNRLDPTPFALIVSGVGFAWAVFRFRLLDILPVARATVIENMADGMLVLDRHHRVLDLNGEARALFGVTARQAVGRPAGEVLAAYPDLVERFRDVMDGGGEVVVDGAGGRRHYDLRISPLRDEAGEVGGRVLVWRDVTPLKATEQELVRQKGSLEAVIEASRDGLLFVDGAGHVRVLNEQAVRLLRLLAGPEAWLGRPAAELLATVRSWAPAASLALISALGGDGDARSEGEHEVASRRVRWAVLPVRAAGSSMGHLVVLRDVTEERMVESLRDDLTHTMVHDLRNPLTAVSGALELLESTAADPRVEDVVRIARASTDRMFALVNGILEVSRLETGRVPLDCTRLPLAPVFEEAVRLQSPLTHRNVKLECRCPRELPPAWADRNLVARVLQNLVGNALKFTPEGTVRLAACVHDGADMLRVDVEDDGPGIPEDLHPRLFQKFVTGRDRHRGSGLGLAFCRLAVEAHGGRIWAANGAPRGARFSFTLPVAR